MIKTETTSNELVRRIVRQIPTCQSFALDTNIIVQISDGKKWISHEFATSKILLCEYVSREAFQEKSLYPINSNQTLNGWISYIKDQFYSVPETEAIYYTIDNKDIDLWILIPTRNFQLLRRLVDLEMRVLDTFSYGNESLYRLEFHILYRNYAKENTIISSKAILVPR
jgi:hypothetical protein